MKKITLIVLLSISLLLLIHQASSAAPDFDGYIEGTGIIANTCTTKNGEVVAIMKIIPGSPAANHKPFPYFIEVGDRILQVNGTNERGFSNVDYLNKILNPRAGEKVKVVLQKGDKSITCDLVSQRFQTSGKSTTNDIFSRGMAQSINGDTITAEMWRRAPKPGEKYFLVRNDTMVGIATSSTSLLKGATFRIDAISKSFLQDLASGKRQPKDLQIIFYKPAQSAIRIQGGTTASTGSEYTYEMLKNNSVYQYYKKNKNYYENSGTFLYYNRNTQQLTADAIVSESHAPGSIGIFTGNVTFTCPPTVQTVPSGVFNTLKKGDKIVFFHDRSEQKVIFFLSVVKSYERPGW